MLTQSTLRLRQGPELKVVRGGSGLPVVWLHGMAAPAPDDEVLAALAEHHQVIAPLTPGLAGLEELGELPTIHDLALFYDSALKALGVERAAVVGHGFGAMLAAELAALQTARIARLVLACPLGLWREAHPVEDVFARRQPEVEQLIWSGAQRRPEVQRSEEDAIEAIIRFANGMGAMANYTWPIPDRGLGRRLYRIEVPTLVVGARSDAWIPAAYAEDFAAAIEGSSTAYLDGSHMAPYEDPAGFARMIGGFIGDGAS
jgi:pimeloyl-ACP methyl ester carboxylesterase